VGVAIAWMECSVKKEKSRNGRTVSVASTNAVQFGRLNVVEHLLNHVDVNQHTTNTNECFGTTTSSPCSNDGVEAMDDDSYVMEEEDDDVMSALQGAVAFGCSDIVKDLMDRCADAK
jgi:hypothetical protein